MPPAERDQSLLWDMLSAAKEIEGYTSGMLWTQFQEDRRTRLAVERLLLIIGEAANKTSVQVREANPTIPWKDMISLRHTLAHECGVELPSRVFRTALKRIPSWILLLEQTLPS